MPRVGERAAGCLAPNRSSTGRFDCVSFAPPCPSDCSGQPECPDPAHTTGFNTQQGALISLTRSLFGDFDIDAILSNSSDYLNGILFLIYLFVAVFIMLSMFLAILAEAQVKVREDEDLAKANPSFREFGIISYGYDYAKTATLFMLGPIFSNNKPPATPVVPAAAAAIVEAPAPGTPALASRVAADGVGGSSAAAAANGGAAAGGSNAEGLAAIALLHDELAQLKKKLPEAAWI